MGRTHQGPTCRCCLIANLWKLPEATKAKDEKTEIIIIYSNNAALLMKLAMVSSCVHFNEKA